MSVHSKEGIACRRLNVYGDHGDSTEDEDYEEPNSGASSPEEEDNVFESDEVRRKKPSSGRNGVEFR